MELTDVKYDFVINLTKFFVEKYRDKEIKTLDLIDRNVVQLAPFILNFSHTFDESIWPPDHPDWYKNLIDFKVQLIGTVAYLPFRLFIKKGYNQEPILLIPGTFTWNWKDENRIHKDEAPCGNPGMCPDANTDFCDGCLENKTKK